MELSRQRPSTPCSPSAGRTERREIATFAMGCFWKPQAAFDKVPGVLKTSVGYTGGTSPDPTYKTVKGGDGHSEALRIEFDPTKVTYGELLQVFHRDNKGDSVCRRAQYRSAIWVHSPEQRALAEEASRAAGKSDCLHILEAVSWTDAEERHQKYDEKREAQASTVVKSGAIASSRKASPLLAEAKVAQQLTESLKVQPEEEQQQPQQQQVSVEAKPPTPWSQATLWFASARAARRKCKASLPPTDLSSI
mmetsp:Transcript_15971/g.28385  ORF Transcript_15971/g.28385 Transcript_15971/m.28385 type:complete len:250 (-) Transcript_15971:12-761(-)